MGPVFQKILVASDGSDPAKRALNTALSLARLYRGELDLISVKAPVPHYIPQRQEEAVLRLENVDEYFHRLHREARTVAGETQVFFRWHMIEGHEAKAVISFVKEHQVEFLIVGQMGHSNILQWVWGGAAQNLTRLAPCSVLVVK